MAPLVLESVVDFALQGTVSWEHRHDLNQEVLPSLQIFLSSLHIIAATNLHSSPAGRVPHDVQVVGLHPPPFAWRISVFMYHTRQELSRLLSWKETNDMVQISLGRNVCRALTTPWKLVRGEQLFSIRVCIHQPMQCGRRIIWLQAR